MFSGNFSALHQQMAFLHRNRRWPSKISPTNNTQPNLNLKTGGRHLLGLKGGGGEEGDNHVVDFFGNGKTSPVIGR